MENHGQALTAGDLLRAFQEKNRKNERINFVVSRTRPLESAVRMLGRKNINLLNKVFVKFSGEIGEDYGGPRREFFRYLYFQFKNGFLGATVAELSMTSGLAVSACPVDG